MSFLPVKGYEGLYEVSSTGQVRSLDRETQGADGTAYRKKGVILRPHPHKDTGCLQVSLWKSGRGRHHYVHRLVGEAHIPNPDNEPEINHIDGVRTNNTRDNLEWVSRRGNAQHAVRTELRKYTHRMTKEQFVECLWSVIAGESYQALSQRTPYQVPFLSTKLRAMARELQVEGELNESLQQQRAQRARINGAKNH